MNGNPAQSRILVHTVNGGTGERYGFDLYGRANFGPISPWASYSYVDSRQTINGVTTEMPGISQHNVRLGTTWAITSKLFVTPSLDIRSTPENVPTGVLGGELQIPYTFNLHVLYTPTKHVEFFATVHNLTNNHYALGGFAYQGQAIPQETLGAVLGVRLVY
jgi:outer membrane receptor protein involved in Fe transport